MAVHHPKYYQGTPNAPADWDQPILINFLTATGSYNIPLTGPEQWVDAAFEILTFALQELGIGAKTAAGYGRMTLETKPVDQEQLLAKNFLERLETLSYQNVAGQINRFYQEWKTLSISPKWKVTLAQAMIDKNAGRVKAVRDKEWYKELVQFVEADFSGN
jgi:CRISPR-associated protein Cmr6